MTFGLKAYYLLQASYWVQQTILLAARVEKPRKDFKELVAHVRYFTSCLQYQADR
jgi:acyl-CoA-dependent ceramide synthase